MTSEVRKRQALYNGRLFEGEAVTLQSLSEPWSEYLASDGSVVRAKVVIVEATRLDGVYEPDGTPVYSVKYQYVHHVSVPEPLRKLPT